MSKDIVIGVLGGMGTYATVHLFQQYAEAFPAEKEWDRPRIVIDNRCTMPSRVRAYLYHENVDQLVGEMSESMQHLKDAGCNRIILACNTSHLFLPQIYAKVPGLEEYVVHIIENCQKTLVQDGIKEVFLLGSEGTIDSRIYQDALAKENINCIAPEPEEYSKLRDCIEAVKQNKYSDEVKKTFLDLVNRYDTCILGCTELPILYEKYKDEVSCRNIYDPLYMGLLKIKEELSDD
jgi:aspartate racemase